MDMLPQGFEYHNGNGTLCLVGEYDEGTGAHRDNLYRTESGGISFWADGIVSMDVVKYDLVCGDRAE